MKKLILFTCVVFAGCETKNVSIKSTDTIIQGAKFEVYDIDSCEYIGCYIGHYAGLLTHKGNCKYCLKRKEK